MRCEFCGGKAVGMLDPDGDPWFHCESECSMYLQLDLLDLDLLRVGGVDTSVREDDLDARTRSMIQIPPSFFPCKEEEK